MSYFINKIYWRKLLSIIYLNCITFERNVKEVSYIKENYSKRHKIVDKLITYRARVDFT